MWQICVARHKNSKKKIQINSQTSDKKTEKMSKNGEKVSQTNVRK